jgi:hypothetical protein
MEDTPGTVKLGPGTEKMAQPQDQAELSAELKFSRAAAG